MPEFPTWIIPIHVFDDASEKQFRLICARLEKDPHFYKLEVEESAEKQGVYTLTVQFAEGSSGPKDDHLKLLNQILRCPAQMRPRPPKTRWDRLLSGNDGFLDGVVEKK